MLRGNLVLTVLLLVLGGYIYYSEYVLEPRQKKAEELKKTLFPALAEVKDDDKLASMISRVVIERSSESSKKTTSASNRKIERVVIERDASAPGGWMMKEPVQDAADKGMVELLIREVARLKAERTVDEKNPDASKYGLEPPKLKVVLTSAPSGGKTTDYVLLVGERSPVGYTTYVRKGGETAIRLVSASIELSVDKKPGDLRRKRLFDFKREDVKAIELAWKDGERIRLERTPEVEKDEAGSPKRKNVGGAKKKKGSGAGHEKWVITAPVRLKADQGNARRLADAMAEFTVTDFITENPSELGDYGLDSPTLTVKVEFADSGRKPVFLYVGKEKKKKYTEGWYVKTNLRKTVYLAATYQKNKIAKKLEDLRDKRIVEPFLNMDVESFELHCLHTSTSGVFVHPKGLPGEWEKKGAGWRAESSRIESILDAIGDLRAKSFHSGKDASGYGLDKPVHRLALRFKDGREVELTLGKAGGSWYVRLKDDPSRTIYGISDTLPRRLPERVVELRRARILNFGATEVERIDVEVDAKGAAPLTVERKKDGAWRLLVAGKEKTPDVARITDFVDALRTLKTPRWIRESLGKEEAAAFGLAKPFTTIRIKLRSGEVRRWSLMLSTRKAKEGYYATCTPLGGVFTVAKDAARKLLQPELELKGGEKKEAAGSVKKKEKGRGDGEETVPQSSGKDVKKVGATTIKQNGEYVLGPGEEDLPRAVIKTDKGDIELVLFEDDAPNTVANFVSLAESGFYDGCRFHRVIKGFVIQGGDPNSKDDDPSNDGMGGPGYVIDDECNPRRKHLRGSLSMANRGPNTNGSQFFICYAPQPHLDGKHTVFGHVLKGMDVVDRIEKGDKILSIRIVQKRNHEYKPVTHPER